MARQAITRLGQTVSLGQSKLHATLRSFFSGPELIAELTNGKIPNILFLDFFNGDRLGTEVADRPQQSSVSYARLLDEFSAVALHSLLASTIPPPLFVLTCAMCR